MGKRQFHRSFIILKPQDSGYSLHSGKEPAGYVKLEIRNNSGKMQLYIQDMKPAMPQQAIYDVVLVSNKEEVQPVKLTSIQVPDSGRAEFEITFDPASVGETKYSVGDYHVLAVVERQLNSDTLRYPLVGYSDKRVELDWSNQVTRRLLHMYRLSRGKALGELAESEDNDGDELVEEEPESSILSNQELDIEATQAENLFYEEQQETEYEEYEINAEILNFVPPDIDYIYHNEKDENREEIHPYETENIFGESNVTQEDTNQDIENQNFYNMQLGSTPYWSKVEQYYNKLFDNHKKVTPFDDGFGEVDWIRVENLYEPVYPQYPYNPYHAYRHNESGLDHYLVGLMRNQGKVQYVIYGVPGIYSTAPPMSMHGFSRWLPVRNGYGAGYWLLYIDAITGNIAYPY